MPWTLPFLIWIYFFAQYFEQMHGHILLYIVLLFKLELEIMLLQNLFMHEKLFK